MHPTLFNDRSAFRPGRVVISDEVLGENVHVDYQTGDDRFLVIDIRTWFASLSPISPRIIQAVGSMILMRVAVAADCFLSARNKEGHLIANQQSASREPGATESRLNHKKGHCDNGSG